MKTLKFSLIGIFIFASMLFTPTSNAKSTVDTSATTLRTELVKMIQNPNLKENGIVKAEIQLQFTIGEKGEINVLKVNSESEYLNDFVRTKLNNQKINIDNINKEMVYYLVVKFELV